jgi:uncharacterized damage-inducible protein DinB
MPSRIEAWQRGPVPAIPDPLQPVAHALIGAVEDAAEAISGLTPSQAWLSPGGAASVGFHLMHLSGSTDRLFTYARGDGLSDAQKVALAAERTLPEPRPGTADLVRAWQETVERCLRQLAATPDHQLGEPRGVGRLAIPSNVRGLLFHAAEHATRHVGQIITTAKIVSGLRLCIVMIAAMSAACRAEEQAPRNAGPPIPYEDVGACPFEGCVYREWIANDAVTLRADRNAAAPVAFSIREGEKVAALGGVVVTTRPGRVEFDMPADVDAPGGPVHIEPGQTLYLLTSRGEGFMKAWFNGRLYDSVDTSTFANGACAGGPRPCVGRVVEPWQFEWWVQIREASGRIGWTQEPEKFDNKDALG